MATEHATLSLGRAHLDLGTPGLGGLNSFGFGVNGSARVVGGAQTTDANGEDFCGFNTYGFPLSNTTCQPFVWRYGVMQPLPTLGGPNGYANMINDRGDIARTSRDLDSRCRLLCSSLQACRLEKRRAARSNNARRHCTA